MKITDEQLVFARDAAPAASRIPTTDAEYLLLAYQSYDNPQCTGMDEFRIDLNRADLISKALRRYTRSGELNAHLILNHLIIMSNLFGTDEAPLLLGRLRYEEYPAAIALLKFISRYPELGLASLGSDLEEPVPDARVTKMLEELVHA